jgi:hypothetical protein
MMVGHSCMVVVIDVDYFVESVDVSAYGVAFHSYIFLLLS